MKNFTLSKMFFSTVFFILLTTTSFSQTVLSTENFNGSFGIWTANANVIIDATTPYEGTNSARFTGTANGTMSTPFTGINILPYNKIDVKFFLRCTSCVTGNAITLRYRPTALSAYQTIRVYTYGNDIKANGVNYAFYATIYSTTTTFSPTGQFEFLSNLTSSSTPKIFIDKVSITGTTFNTITNGPGGVISNLETWLRADMVNGSGVATDNSFVDSWQDVGKGNDANVIDATNATLTNKPLFKNTASSNINFNPVVLFNNDPTTSVTDYTGLVNRAELNATGGFFTQEQFIVVMNDTPSIISSTTASVDLFCAQGGLNNAWDNDGTGFGFGRYSVRFDNEVLSFCLSTTSSSGTGIPVASRGYGVNHNGTGVNYSTLGILSSRNNTTATGNQLFLNANRIDNQEVGVPQFLNSNNRRFWLGRSQIYSGSFGGRIAEVITYSTRKNDTSERRRIESYLAIKYGITLGINGTSMNYENSNGTVIWDAAASAGYNSDIAGIGLDNASQLNQKQSKSINPIEVMTIGLADILPTNTANTNTFATNRSFLVWGSNGGNMINSGTPIDVDLGPTTITTITEVVNRRWKVVETGSDVATTRVSVPTAAFVSGLPPLAATDAYVMVVATNAAFTTGVETIFMSTLGSDQTLLYDFDGTHYITFGVAHRATNPLHITLDGFDDFVRIGDSNELGTNFSIMTWVRPNGANTLGNERTIISKKPDATSGYQLVLQNDNKVRMEWYAPSGLKSLVTNTALPNLKWHNIAVTYNASSYNLTIYIDGVVDNSSNITQGPNSTNGLFSIGGQYINKTTINNLWKGDIDELRMWNVVVSQTEIQYIMNQEILEITGNNTTGTIIPTTITKNDIAGLKWNTLFAYYSMNSYIGTHLDDDSLNINRGSLVIPDKISINPQTAQMPYESGINGAWSANASWTNGVIQDVPYSLSIVDNATPISWNIVKTNHNITSNGNKVVLGLYVDSAILNATNDTKLEVTHYLNLNGKIDLEGKSQLIQTLNSDLNPLSSGSLERDQQGTKIFHNYNYWSSPVGTINNTSNNNAYTVAGVMKDGTTATPQNIVWTAGLNGSATSPITLSNYWIFKFQNLTNNYANWQSAGNTGSLNPGQGYTLKGSGTTNSTQNYTFVGKPNNGLITSTVAANNLNLSGNPYSSSIDTNAFITANAASLTGTLYFWEHYVTNNTHSLANYQGGYATRTLVGGTPPVAPALISGLGSSSKIPSRYIPVGQGFFVVGSATGGAITFNNDQRAFVKEDSASSYTLFKSNNATVSADHFDNNANDRLTEDTFIKIRLGFTSKEEYHRQILLGFMNENATSGIDKGYDATFFENNPSDMYFLNNGSKLNISGEATFNVNNIYPIGIKSSATGEVKFMIDAVENLDPNQQLFIHDNTNDSYNEITSNMFTVEVPFGVTDNRFSLRFVNQNALLNNNNFSLVDGITIAYTNNNNILNIKNNVVDTTVQSVSLFNMLGQGIATYDVKDQSQNNIALPIKTISSGTYIVKIKTDKGDTSRKIIFN
ncbi:LamG-like jellyroll fold domain-containing protein [Flavobacterium sp.]|uniref:LamG-like jellyroll fold domain-containing protein n=1 Tax=Flavobacterium sp. TaxID=239 RepID=UPI003752E1B1